MVGLSDALLETKMKLMEAERRQRVQVTHTHTHTHTHRVTYIREQVDSIYMYRYSPNTHLRTKAYHIMDDSLLPLLYTTISMCISLL